MTAKLTMEDYQYQSDLVARYRPICEAVLDSDCGGLTPMDLMNLAGAISNDKVVSGLIEALHTAWLAQEVAKREVGRKPESERVLLNDNPVRPVWEDDFEISPDRFQLEAQQNFPLQAGHLLSREQKLSLRRRLQKKNALPRG